MAKSPTKVAIVVQRYGAGIIGGAEAHARLVAEQLHRQAGYEVEVYTTTSVDYSSWDDTLPAGTQSEGDVVVHRFRPRWQRGVRFKALNGLLKLGWCGVPASLQVYLERLWIKYQGPFVPDLVDTLVRRQDEYAAVIFFTYLYYPTLIGLPRISRPTILIPTAHDERPFYMHEVGRLLHTSSTIFANTLDEAQLIRRVHAVDRDKIHVVGLGLNRPASIRVPSWTKGQPLRLLYMGRVGLAKGVDELLTYWREARVTHPSLAATLRIAGPLEDSFRMPMNDPETVYLGVLDESQKAEELRLADVVINPSHYESLSLLVLEAIVAHKLVLVQKACPVLRAYAQRYPLVWGYETAGDFSEALDKAQAALSDAESLRSQLVKQAEEVGQLYSWDQVIAAFQKAISPS